MNYQFTMQEIIISAIIAFIITSILIHAWEFLRLTRKRLALYNYHSRDFSKILKRCYQLFPTDIIQFRGEVFCRGMRVHVTTNQKNDFEGHLIGLSKENLICVLTSRYIIAQELNKIQDMYVCAPEKQLPPQE